MHDTTITILGGTLFLALLFFFGGMTQMSLECRKIGMEHKYTAIEIQGICK